MLNSRCGQFSLEVEEIVVSGAPVTLRVPLRRCALAERMIALIAKTEQGREVALKLVLDGSTQYLLSLSTVENGEAPPDKNKIHAAFGPDLDVIHAAECTVERCRESCTPGFKLIVEQFGFSEDAERETGAGCFDPTQVSPDTVRVTNDAF